MPTLMGGRRDGDDGAKRLRIISALAIVLGVTALWWMPDSVPRFLSGPLALTRAALLLILGRD